MLQMILKEKTGKSKLKVMKGVVWCLTAFKDLQGFSEKILSPEELGR